MPLGDAVDPKRLAALGKNLSEMLPRPPLSSAILRRPHPPRRLGKFSQSPLPHGWT
jgi:hypothetical protein